MQLLSKSCSYTLSFLIALTAFNIQVDFSKFNQINNLDSALNINGQKAEAAQTQIDKYSALGRSIKGLKKKGGPKIPWSDMYEAIKEIMKDPGVPIPENFKFVSPDSAKVEWNDASRACDQVKGKLKWYNNQKTCF
jgi:hypothetical protein